MQIEPWQAAKVKTRIEPRLRYLRRLQARLEHLGALPFDPLARNVTESVNAIGALHKELDDIAST